MGAQREKHDLAAPPLWLYGQLDEHQVMTAMPLLFSLCNRVTTFIYLCVSFCKYVCVRVWYNFPLMETKHLPPAQEAFLGPMCHIMSLVLLIDPWCSTADTQRRGKACYGVCEPALSAKSNLSCSVDLLLEPAVSIKPRFLPLQPFWRHQWLNWMQMSHIDGWICSWVGYQQNLHTSPNTHIHAQIQLSS